MRRLRTIICAALTGVAALALASAHARQQAAPRAPAESPHMCAAYTDAASGQTRIIDVTVRSENPMLGVLKMGDALATGFVGHRAGDQCALLTASRVRMQATCVAGAFAGSFTIGPRAGDDDDEGPPPTPVTFKPVACP